MLRIAEGQGSFHTIREAWMVERYQLTRYAVLSGRYHRAGWVLAIYRSLGGIFQSFG